MGDNPYSFRLSRLMVRLAKSKIKKKVVSICGEAWTEVVNAMLTTISLSSPYIFRLTELMVNR